MARFLKNLVGILAPRFHPTSAARHVAPQPPFAASKLEPLGGLVATTSGDMLVECLRGRVLTGADERWTADDRRFNANRSGQSGLRFAMTMAAAKML
jgi:hypothetical protein